MLSWRISHGILLKASLQLQQIALKNKCGPRGSVYNSKQHEFQTPAFLPHVPLEPTRLDSLMKINGGRWGGCHYNNRFSAACAHSLFESAKGMKPTRVFCLERGRFTQHLKLKHISLMEIRACITTLMKKNKHGGTLPKRQGKSRRERDRGRKFYRWNLLSSRLQTTFL